MSVKIMGAIWDLDIPHEQAWVLMAYADHADHDGRNAYPSVPLIAYKTGYSERQITRIVHQLVSAELLIIEQQGGGRGKPTVYCINLGAAPRKGDKMSPISRKGDKLSPIPMQRMTSATETVTSDAVETVTFQALKGDIAVSPEPLTVLTVNDGVEPFNRPTPPPLTSTRARAGQNGGGGVAPPELELPPHELDLTLDETAAWNLLMTVAPDFNGAARFVRDNNAYLVAYWCLAADSAESVENPAGMIRAGVRTGHPPSLSGAQKQRWYALLREMEQDSQPRELSF